MLQRTTAVSVAVTLMYCAAGAYSPVLCRVRPEPLRYRTAIRGHRLGISNTVATIPGDIVGVAVTGWLVQRTGSFSAPFVLTATISALGAVIFLLMGSGERQID
ncbi:MAG: hypothetical protein U0163_14400 [Gemmatimonadaceae bacterium]